ncbi:SpaH/EbpB family LPXTG-anchored major pilin [Paeniglutamicibacter sp. NPDC091659]|uniref:SpaH/EbpB family LPXTG-anchored major pilin n=1 Tax=Paeniglutamicibacter sp. NPDC091659 TaxID=3364389 RepID=UPI003821E648
MSKKIVQRLGAALGATAIGAVALIGATPAAFAAPADYGNIDTDRDGSLTVHKYLHQTGDVVGDPSQAPADGDFTDPVAGVTFTAYPLLKDGAPVNLGVASSWTGLKDLTPGAGCTAPAGYGLGTGITIGPTNASGIASIPLDLGAYQVCETDAPADIVDRALPFIVTVPLPHENGWVYDVHTYPKNGKGEITKTIEEQQDTGLGSVVKFPVTAPVPTMADEWTGFAISDTLDARLAVEGTGVASVTLDGVALDPSYYTVSTDGQKVIVKFTDAGVAWLNTPKNSQAGKKIEVVFQGKVVTLGNGAIPNTADLWVNNPNLDPTGGPGGKPPVPSNEVKTNWGALEVQKRAAGTTGTEGLLNGAVFEVYNAVAPYAATCDDAVKTGSAISVNGATQFTSAGTGVISIAGLFVSDSENPVKDALQRCYVLVEVAAPAGYVLPADSATPVAVKIGQTTVSDNVEIVNTQQEVPELPLTGAAGQIMLVSIGSAAVLFAVVLIMVNRRRSTVQQ